MGRAGFTGGELEGLHVLVLDESETERELLQNVLMHCGALVTTAPSVEAALQSLERFVPEVIVCDVGTDRGERAFQFLTILRARPAARGGRVPVIAIVDDAATYPISQTLERGYRGYVVRPFEAWRLCRVVAEVADSHRERGNA